MKRLISIFMIFIFLLFTVAEASARTEIGFYISFGIVIGGLTIFLSIGGADFQYFSFNEPVPVTDNYNVSATGLKILSW